VKTRIGFSSSAPTIIGSEIDARQIDYEHHLKPIGYHSLGGAMELRHLRYFISVAEELNVRRAAARLHIAQPALSRQIRQLEVDVGAELFRREKRRIFLSAAGAVFLPEARRTLAAAQHASEVARAGQCGELGALSVGFVESAAFGILPAVVKRFRQQFPAVRLSLSELRTNEQLMALHERRLDIGFLRTPIDDRTIDTRVVVRESLMAALPVSHPLAKKATIKLSQLAGEPFILFPRALGPNFFDQIVGACRRAGFGPKIAQEAVQMATIVSLVATGLGVALVPASLKGLHRKGAVYKPLWRHPIVELSLAWRADNHNPTLAHFTGLMDGYK
jgi:DNA-binding transcriptional LysR family regulator